MGRRKSGSSVILDTGGPAAPRECHARDRGSESNEDVNTPSTASRQLEAQIAALAARQAEIESQLRQLAERESRLSVAEDALAQSRSKFEAEQQLSRAPTPELAHDEFDAEVDADPTDDEALHEADVDATDVLRRLQAAGILRDPVDRPTEVTAETITTVRTTEVRHCTSTRESEDEADDSAVGETTASAPRNEIVRREETRSDSVKLSSTAGRDGDEDDLQESIDRYMERLLNRSASKTTTPAPKSPQPVQNETHEPSVPRWSAPTAPSATTTLDLEPAPQRKALKPARTIAPESQCDLAAMRELANASAKAHLAQYARDERRSMLQTKLSVLIVSLVSAVFLLWISPRGSTPWCGGIVSLLVAGFWGLQIAVITGKLTIDAQGGLLITRAREKSSKLAQRLRRAK